MRGKRELPRKRNPLLVFLSVVFAAAVLLVVAFALAKQSAPSDNEAIEPEEPPVESLSVSMPEALPEPEQPAEKPAPPPEPQNRFVLSFLGDCTLSSSHYTGHFESVVGDDLAYPFSNVAEILLADDLTLANLECSFSEQRLESESQYAFCGQPKYARSLVLGGVECVSMGNNHTNDFGRAGVEHTAAILEQEQITGIQENQGCCIDLQHEDGTTVRIGIYVRSMNGWTEQIKQGVARLREEGADIVIVCIHAGAERIYVPTKAQVALAHAAIDSGADLVVGTHSHILQPTETYKDGEILYSLGNFCFGGNRGPSDMDTVIAQMILQVEENGVSWEMEYIPCSISSVPNFNDYRPTPYEPGTKGYERCLKKLETPWDPTTAEEAAAAKAAAEAAKAAEEAAAQAAQEAEHAQTIGDEQVFGELAAPEPEAKPAAGVMFVPLEPEEERH